MSFWKRATGFTESTAEHLVLDAGAFCNGYDFGLSFDDNRKAGRVVSATQGGGGFSVSPTYRQIKVDGLPTYWKGGEEITDVVSTLNLKMLEHDAKRAKMAIGAAKVKAVTKGDKKYLSVVARDHVEDLDYIDNLLWIGKLRGSGEPLVIVIHNALALNGISWSFQDGQELITDVTFTAHLDPATNEDPFELLYPATEEEYAAAEKEGGES